MAVTRTDVIERFPGIGGDLSNEVLDSLVAVANQISSTGREVALYCAAHIITLEKQAVTNIDGGLGEIGSENIGGKGQSYRTISETGRDVYFATTHYGRTFLMLEKASPRRAIGVMVPRSSYFQRTY